MTKNILYNRHQVSIDLNLRKAPVAFTILSERYIRRFKRLKAAPEFYLIHTHRAEYQKDTQKLPAAWPERRSPPISKGTFLELGTVRSIIKIHYQLLSKRVKSKVFFLPLTARILLLTFRRNVTSLRASIF